VIHRLERRQRLDRPLGEVFAFFADAANLERLTPGFLHFRILTELPMRMRQGARIDYALSLFGVPVRWRTRIAEWQPERYFVDEQESGPFAAWRHLHEFEPTAEGVVMTDTVEYSVPFGAIGRLAHAAFVRGTVERIFDHRARVMVELFGGGPVPAASQTGLRAPA